MLVAGSSGFVRVSGLKRREIGFDAVAMAIGEPDVDRLDSEVIIVGAALYNPAPDRGNILVAGQR